MSHAYKAVQWTPFKKAFDAALAAGIVLFLAVFIAASLSAAPSGQRWSEIQILIRAFGACAFGLLSLILIIGPAARLWPALLPLVYNRRHLGVTCFLIALAHAGLVILWYHGFSTLNPFISLLVSNPRYTSLQGFPFESLGLAALLILFVMAATSHDFWNANLGPRTWKAIHMAVYAAYALLVAHVLLGAVQQEKSALYPIAVGLSAAFIAALHIIAGAREARKDKAGARLVADGWIEAGPARDIPDQAARVLCPPGRERIAVFRDGPKIFALSNQCRHQSGPLGEGRIVDGCVTCPWHGYQYRPEDGVSPPPFAEKVATYRTKLVGGNVYVHPEPSPLGTQTAPSILEDAS